MGIKLSQLEEGSRVILHITGDEKALDMDAVIEKKIREDIAIITLGYETDKKLSFDKVHIDMEYSFEEVVPILWRNVKIVNYKSGYALQTSVEGIRNNRRSCFRVWVGVYAQLKKKHGTQQVLVKDISMSGFALADKGKKLDLHKHDMVTVIYRDSGYEFEMQGIVRRVEEREDMNIYGLEFTGLCSGLSNYLNMKQTKNRNKRNRA